MLYYRYASETGLDVSEIRRRLSPSELATAQEDMARYYRELERLGRNPQYAAYLRSLSARAYMSRLDELRMNVRHEIELLAGQQQSLFGDGLRETYSEAYNRTIFDTQQGLGVGTSFTQVNARAIQRAADERWMGDNYSGRIWANRDALAHSLDTIIPRGIAAGRNPRVIARDIRRATGASKYNAERLARTEFAHMANRATFDAYEETGVERYQIDAALDLRTCKICGDQDRKIYAVKDRKEGVNAPTFHPNCRCSTIPYFEPDDIDAMFDAPTRIARGADGSHYHVPADMTYNEWKAKYVDGDGDLRL